MCEPLGSRCLPKQAPKFLLQLLIRLFSARHSGDIRLAGADDGTMVSRTHVADIVSVLEASIEQPEPGMVVNVADDLPSTRYEVIARTMMVVWWMGHVGCSKARFAVACNFKVPAVNELILLCCL